MGKHTGTPATSFLAQQGVTYTEHVYDYVEHGGTAVSSTSLGVPEHEVVKTLVMQNDKRQQSIEDKVVRCGTSGAISTSA